VLVKCESECLSRVRATESTCLCALFLSSHLNQSIKIKQSQPSFLLLFSCFFFHFLFFLSNEASTHTHTHTHTHIFLFHPIHLCRRTFLNIQAFATLIRKVHKQRAHTQRSVIERGRTVLVHFAGNTGIPYDALKEQAHVYMAAYLIPHESLNHYGAKQFHNKRDHAPPISNEDEQLHAV
jgi:hypothetical protein